MIAATDPAFSTQQLAVVVSIAAALVTFVATVMATKDQQRLKNSQFGAAAGVSIGALAALVTNNSPSLVIFGALGSGAGAAVGWLVYLLIVIFASRPGRPGRPPSARPLLRLLVDGLDGVEKQAVIDERRGIERGLDWWSDLFCNHIEEARAELEHTGRTGKVDDRLVDSTLTSWLYSMVDAFNLVMIGIKPDTLYGTRACLIVFGTEDDKPKGLYWIHYAATFKPHNVAKPFNEDSAAYRVVVGDDPSPMRVLAEKGKAPKNVVERSGSDYKAFTLYRVNDSVVISVDWQRDSIADDPYIDRLDRAIQLYLVPACSRLIECRTTPPQETLRLAPLPPRREEAWPLAPRAFSPGTSQPRG